MPFERSRSPSPIASPTLVRATLESAHWPLSGTASPSRFDSAYNSEGGSGARSPVIRHPDHNIYISGSMRSMQPIMVHSSSGSTKHSLDTVLSASQAMGRFTEIFGPALISSHAKTLEWIGGDDPDLSRQSALKSPSDGLECCLRLVLYTLPTLSLDRNSYELVDMGDVCTESTTEFRQLSSLAAPARKIGLDVTHRLKVSY